MNAKIISFFFIPSIQTDGEVSIYLPKQTKPYQNHPPLFEYTCAPTGWALFANNNYNTTIYTTTIYTYNNHKSSSKQASKAAVAAAEEEDVGWGANEKLPKSVVVCVHYSFYCNSRVNCVNCLVYRPYASVCVRFYALCGC